jgi:hypothetical protein
LSADQPAGETAPCRVVRLAFDPERNTAGLGVVPRFEAGEHLVFRGDTRFNARPRIEFGVLEELDETRAPTD